MIDFTALITAILEAAFAVTVGPVATFFATVFGWL